ncbi:MAG: PepSY domain-containing protein [Pseudomonadales bacterium]|nr:PepSY domain-containing protein [Pseudomonadales bacterium]MBO6563127.1 PepSY domain-containing protein [Pseudomonadales bacterium]MBO6596925.1 PepSY domain-containing protein [Pseudomonadales bacterium]MBO6823086.1 PepSY domain-containing protein [Pseudomonadales bacterium]
MALIAKTKKETDQTWFLVHSWIGLKLSVLMTFILITGTFAVLSYDIDWLLNPEMHSSAQSQQTNWGAVFDNARAQYPHADMLSIDRRDDHWFAAQVTLQTQWGELGRSWHDPETGNFQGTTAWFNVQRFFRMTHRHLMLPSQIGIPIVTSLAVPLLVSLTAGLFVYKKFWRGFFRWPRFSKPTRVWSGDLHRLMGLWSTWFIVLIAFTSIWYLVEVMGGRSPSMPSPSQVEAERELVLPISLTGDSINQMVTSAEKTLPGLRVQRITLPRDTTGVVSVQGQVDAVLVRARANAVVFDPATGEGMGSHRGEQLNLHTRISEMADPIHFGTFGGWWTKLLWFLMGCLMSGLSITGCVIYVKRLRKPITKASITADSTVAAS